MRKRAEERRRRRGRRNLEIHKWVSSGQRNICRVEEREKEGRA